MSLENLKTYLDSLLESFNILLNLEFTVLNSNPIFRISGTGKYKNHGWITSNNKYTPKVIDSKEPMIVINTSEIELEIKINNPENYSIILHPIILKDKVEGVLVLASFDAEQQKTLIDKKDELLYFLENIASLISSKLSELELIDNIKQVTKQLRTVFETNGNGLILYRKGGEILQINNKAKIILHYGEEYFFDYLFRKVANIAEEAIIKQDSVKKELHIKVKDKNISFLVETHSVMESENIAYIMIQNYVDVQNLITQNSSNDVKTEIITQNIEMVRIKEKISKISHTSSSVLLLGESGTGKEILARNIHEKSIRNKNPFVTVNCAAIPQSLLESELFGYEEGAFTGAKKGGRIGKFMLANGGTLFLDEIGDMPLYMQSKLLRVLGDKKVDRIGSSKLVEVDVRIIAATNKNLEELIERKEFREDLYYRLCVIPIVIPPLRDRKEDIPLFVSFFINKFSKKFNKDIKGVSDSVHNIICEYEWPGNVRELENAIEYMVNIEQKKYISIESVPDKLLKKDSIDKECNLNITFEEPEINGSLKFLTNKFQRNVIDYMNKYYKGNLSVEEIQEVCNKLEISLSTYYRIIKN